VKAAARELLERALELARGGVHVYEAALGWAPGLPPAPPRR
jgi:hypothetical protein